MDFYKDDLFIGSHPLFELNNKTNPPLYPAVGIIMINNYNNKIIN
jgi:hypothetical protein